MYILKIEEKVSKNMLLVFTKCSTCSGLRNTSELCCSLPAEETKLNQACGKKTQKKRGQAQPFPSAAGPPPAEPPSSPSRTFGVLKQQQNRFADNKPASDGPNAKETAERGTRTGTHAREETRGTVKCQNSYKH